MANKTLNRRERKKEAMRQKIIETALRLFRQSSVDEITMEKIAEEVDIAKGTLYNYFSSKESIIIEYVKKHMKKIEKDILNKLDELPNTEARLLAFFNHMFNDVIGDDDDIFRAILKHRFHHFYDALRNETTRSGAKDIIRNIIVYGQEKGELRSDVPTDKLVSLMEFNVLVYFLSQLIQDPDYLFDGEQIKLNIELFINGARYREED